MPAAIPSSWSPFIAPADNATIGTDSSDSDFSISLTTLVAPRPSSLGLKYESGEKAIDEQSMITTMHHLQTAYIEVYLHLDIH